jgi:hypothetical protein
MYFRKLSSIDQRAFVSPGTRCDLDGERIAEGGDLARAKLHINFRLEHPDVLEERLTAALDKCHALPQPLLSDCQSVCQKFLLWAVGKSTNWFNQPTRHNKATQYEQTRPDRVFSANPTRRFENEVIADKRCSVVDWLKQQKTEHLVMPNELSTVLPYMDKREAHSAYVMEMERLMKFEHLDASIDLVFSNGMALDNIMSPVEEEKVMDRNEVDEAAANGYASARPGKSRYGNTVMGPKAALPEQPSIASFPYFCSIWSKGDDKKWRRSVKLRKWMPFAKCDQCAGFRLAMADTQCPVEKSRLKALHREHLERVKRERMSYLVRQRLSIMYPDRYLSLIIDGADSSHCTVPHIAERSHISDACPKVKMHILGCIAHGRDTYAFTCPPHIAQGHSVTIQVIHEVLLDIKSKEGGIPPIINIQLDNTTKQNKGRFLMAYLGYLVQQGVIKEAYCNFLPVGHTHEDIDQFFSRLSMYCRHHNAPDVAALLECIRKSYKKYGRHPIVKEWDTVANISSYLAKFTHKHLSKDITLYYQLRIAMGRCGDIAGKPIMQARTWPGTDKDDKSDFWRGLQPDTSYVEIFKNPPNLLGDRDLVPGQAQPQHVGDQAGSETRMNYTAELRKQREMIEKMMEYFPSIFKYQVVQNVRRLLESLASNLESLRPVTFAWDQNDMDDLYGNGQYVASPVAPLLEDAEDPNLFDDQHVLDEIRRARPNPMRDPRAFAAAVRAGEVNLLQVENCHACELTINKFYLQRPRSEDHPFTLVKVVKIIYNSEEKKTQWGAWVHPWEISTTGDNIDYYHDPWHASGAHKASQRYNERLPMREQSASWTYPMSALEEFQDEVVMKTKWTKPKYTHKHHHAPQPTHQHTNAPQYPHNLVGPGQRYCGQRMEWTNVTCSQMRFPGCETSSSDGQRMLRTSQT